MADEDLVLFTNPMSRGRIARWMLEELGRPYRVEVLDYGPAMQTPAYLALNPMGKVPTLRHGDAVVTECAAICAYLAECFPEQGLGPRAEERAAYWRWLFFGAGPLDAAVTAKALGFAPAGPRQEGMAGYGSLARVVDTLAVAVSAHPYIAGERFTAADVYVGAQIGWGLEFGNLPDRPELRAYWERVGDRPARRRAAALDDALVSAS